MEYRVIKKDISKLKVKPNLLNYEETCKNFKWEDVEKNFEGLPNGGLNIAHEAIDKHANGPLADKTALIWIGKNGEREEYSYKDLKRESNKFANILKDLGFEKGERIFMYSPRVPYLYITTMGIFKNRSVMSPLFAQFGPEPVAQRMVSGDAKGLITTKRLYEKKILQILDKLSQLKYIFLIDAEDDVNDKVLSLPKLMKNASEEFEIPPTDPEDMSLLHFTSGTTGKPKGVIHVHKAIYTHWATGYYVLDFHENDIFWCTADPGWVTGTSYSIISPWLHGITNVVYEGEFDAEKWLEILQNEKVTVWYTAPTAIRRFIRYGIDPRKEYDLSNLRHALSVGEPLNPEGVMWGVEKLGLPIHDTWWQTETGGIMIANYPAMDIKAGSMGKPIPGVEANVLIRDEEGNAREAKVNESGDLVLKKGWPSMMRGYLHMEEKYKKSFVGDWYITEDLASIDEDKYFWFVGRSKDIIKTSGHMVGPYEVESAIMEHPAVAEVGVIGKPDPIAGEIVKAFVSLKKGYEPSKELEKELIALGRRKLGVAIAPKEIEFVDSLPKTRSGKIMRRLLKAKELGLPLGDTSTLEK